MSITLDTSDNFWHHKLLIVLIESLGHILFLFSIWFPKAEGLSFVSPCQDDSLKVLFNFFKLGKWHLKLSSDSIKTFFYLLIECLSIFFHWIIARDIIDKTFCSESTPIPRRKIHRKTTIFFVCCIPSLEVYETRSYLNSIQCFNTKVFPLIWYYPTPAIYKMHQLKTLKARNSLTLRYPSLCKYIKRSTHTHTHIYSHNHPIQKRKIGSFYLNREPNRTDFTGKGNPLMVHCHWKWMYLMSHIYKFSSTQEGTSHRNNIPRAFYREFRCFLFFFFFFR